ncbi:MAG TPA: ferritin-like domain-containing protein [Sphingomonas sp.]|jgi:hypothetical protein
MAEEKFVLDLIDAATKRREERRRFLRDAGSGAAAVGGLSLLAACGSDDDDIAAAPSPTPSASPTPTGATSDADILNFALQLEYLEAQFYSFAAFGTGLPANQLTGAGTQGAVTGGRQVTFTDPVVAQYAREIAADEIAHVAFLRSALGASATAQPAINIAGDANGAFTAAARAAGVVGATGTFDPYANDENFLLGAYIFEDVGVTAYKGASPLITNKTFLEAAAGILAAEAYHAGLVRTVLFAKGVSNTSLRTIAGQISDARDSLDGSSDLDQGIVNQNGSANLVPTDANALAYSRSPGQVLNIVYLNRLSVSSGGFFPAGVNGALRASASSAG